MVESFLVLSNHMSNQDVSEHKEPICKVEKSSESMNKQYLEFISKTSSSEQLTTTIQQEI
jgi:hypothetical protein